MTPMDEFSTLKGEKSNTYMYVKTYNGIKIAFLDQNWKMYHDNDDDDGSDDNGMNGD